MQWYKQLQERTACMSFSLQTIYILFTQEGEREWKNMPVFCLCKIHKYDDINS